MDSELAQLEKQIEQLIHLHTRLKSENRDLRLLVARFEADKKALSDKVDTALARLDVLIERLPQPQEERA
jgi:cell division protein ZapB